MTCCHKIYLYLLTESHCSYLTTFKICMSKHMEKHQHVKCILTSSMSLCKPYGSFYLMWSLSRPSRQVYWSSVSITRFSVSSPVCLPTRPTTQKSKFSHLHSSVASWFETRVLVAWIRFLGECLCPQCLVTKANVPDMGKPADMFVRQSQIRVNNSTYQKAIKKACKWIFKGKSLNSKKVNDLLKDNSWIPTQVSNSKWQSISTNVCLRMHSLNNFPLNTCTSISFYYLLSICFMSSNWEFERQSSHIWCTSYMHMGET